MNISNIFSSMDNGKKTYDPIINDDSYSDYQGVITLGNTYDNIKKFGNLNYNKYTSFIKTTFDVDLRSTDVATGQIYDETSLFYNTSVSTSILSNKIETLTGNVLDGWKITKNGKTVSNINIDNITQEVILGQNELDKITTFNLLFSNYLIYLVINDDEIELQTYEPWRYFKKDGKLHIVSYLGDETYSVFIDSDTDTEKVIYTKTEDETIRQRGETSPKSNTLIKNYIEVKETSNVVSNASRELSLMDSELVSSIQKEVKISPTNVVIDRRLAQKGRVNLYQNAIVEIEREEGLNIDSADTSELKYYQTNMRSSEFQIMTKVISDRLDNSLLADKKELGIDPTATAVNFNSSEVAKKINRIKNNISKTVNAVFKGVLGSNYRLEVDDYKINIKSINDEQDAYEIQNGLVSRRTKMQQRNPNMKDKDLDIEYLTIEIKMGNTLTVDEKNKAIELGLLEETLTITPEENTEEFENENENEKEGDNNEEELED